MPFEKNETIVNLHDQVERFNKLYKKIVRITCKDKEDKEPLLDEILFLQQLTKCAIRTARKISDDNENSANELREINKTIKELKRLQILINMHADVCISRGQSAITMLSNIDELPRLSNHLNYAC